MPLDISFLQIARNAFDPYTPHSGTEHIGPLLYSLVRMTRPEHVVEFGTGYTTLFVLQALADNVADIAAERQLLREKTLALGDLSNIKMEKDAPAGPIRHSTRDPRVIEWFGSGGKACAVDPGFYLIPY